MYVLHLTSLGLWGSVCYVLFVCLFVCLYVVATYVCLQVVDVFCVYSCSCHKIFIDPEERAG